MFEILFLVGLLAWLGAMLLEYLYTLPSFGTVAIGALLCPLVAAVDYLREKKRNCLQGVGRSRSANPPERFYWPWRRARLRRSIGWNALIAGSAWCAVFFYPAGRGEPRAAWIGVAVGMLAILVTGRGLSRTILYFQACQWFDRMTPWIVGFCRRTLYRLSDNPEFLEDPSFDRKPSGKKID